MPLIVTVGPLPNNGDRADASTFLEDWINGTSVIGFDNSSFNSSINFVTTQTNTPALGKRFAIWFKRGEGTFYFRDEIDRTDSRYTGPENNVLLALGPHRTIAVENQNTAVSLHGVGDALTHPTSDNFADLLAFEDVHFVTHHGRRVPFYRGHRVGTFNPTKTSMYCVFAIDSGYTGLPVRAYEWGFASVLIASGGSNVARGAFAKVKLEALDEWFLHPRAAGWTGETSYLNAAVIVETNATTSMHLATVFKKPGFDWAWRLGY